MCLLTNNKNSKVAKKPIRCMKIVSAITENGETRYMSFYGFDGTLEYKIGETISMNPEGTHQKLRSAVVPQFSQSGDMHYRVGPGIHTFLPEANGVRSLYEWGKKDLIWNGDSSSIKIAVLECEIPAKARYFEGIATCFNKGSGVDEHGYVSNKLHVIRALTEEEIEKMEFVDIEY